MLSARPEGKQRGLRGDLRTSGLYPDIATTRFGCGVGYDDAVDQVNMGKSESEAKLHQGNMRKQ